MRVNKIITTGKCSDLIINQILSTSSVRKHSMYGIRKDNLYVDIVTYIISQLQLRSTHSATLQGCTCMSPWAALCLQPVFHCRSCAEAEALSCHVAGDHC